MSKDSGHITRMLVNVGVPREAIATTLAKEGFAAMREYVANDGYADRRIVYVYPKDCSSMKQIDKATLAFYLLSKELALSGKKVYCCSLVDVARVFLTDSDDSDIEAMRFSLESADMIAIRGFHDAGGRVEQFLTPYQIAWVGSWLYRHHRADKGLVLLGAAPLETALDWWPASTLAFLSKHSISFEAS